ncbi:MAG: GDP-D-mannose 3, 5-epimerase, partial [Solirubrobacteraceae bacterium]|nr:GDP-D-mannose 3, 5-epimerase [Solirubrobacteraceae bacterium]
MARTALVTGAGGFIGTHLVSRLRREGMWVRGVDIKAPAFGGSAAHDFVVADLRDAAACRDVLDRQFDEVYQLAADMGGAGYVFTGEHDAEIVHNSALININMVAACAALRIERVFFSSSACVYPGEDTTEDSAYPARPDSEYGWEKLFAERLYLTQARAAG